MPTTEQALASVIVCQMLSNLYQPINLFRYDDVNKAIYILAGENDTLEINIPREGEWRFIEHET